jgi:hypothetical protein
MTAFGDRRLGRERTTRVRGFGTIFRCGPAFHAIVMGTFAEQFGLLCALYGLWARLREPAVAHQLEAAAESAE